MFASMFIVSVNSGNIITIFYVQCQEGRVSFETVWQRRQACIVDQRLLMKLALYLKIKILHELEQNDHMCTCIMW